LTVNSHRIRTVGLACLLILAYSCGGKKTTTSRPGAWPPAATVPPGAPQTPSLPDASFGASGAGPVIRIGIDTALKEVRISSSEGYFVLDKDSPAAQRQVVGEVRIQIGAGGADGAATYRIQVVSLANAANAAELKERLAGELGVPTVIRVNPDNGVSQIRVGAFASKEEAQDYLPTVQPGYPDAFIVLHEDASVKKDAARTTLTLTGADGLSLSSRAGFQVLPGNDAAFLRAGGKAYRGSFDVFPNKSKSITLVNQLPMEDYLPGVVPAEMSPSHFPEFAALAAQAIAARTYALKNMGRFRSEGFDLTDDTRTQVYGGVGVEKPMTSEIVRQTAGIAVYYDGKPIDAMFTSTCGGRTEDIALVYGSKPVPYLKSVVCAIERGEDGSGARLAGTHAVTGSFRTADGAVATRNLELARALRIVPEDAPLTQSALEAPVRKDEAKSWIYAATAVAKPARRVPPQGSGGVSRGDFLREAVAAFFGEEEVGRRISQADVDYYMATLSDADRIPPPEQAALSYLMHRKLWRPTTENTADVDSPMRRGDALALLVDWVEAEKPEVLLHGDFVEVAGRDRGVAAPEGVKVKSGGKTREFKLAKDLSLFRIDPGGAPDGGWGHATPIPGLKLIGAEKVAFHLNGGGEIDFMEIELSPSGAASDRFSAAATWKVTIPRNTVAEKLRGLVGDLGGLLDLQPALLGQSGRVVRIQAVGARKSVEVNGYRVRGLLGLQDTLFTLTREFGADGAVSAFTFSGRGSGHGIGLCQTGAYGMAKAGKGYEEILKTYYTGVDIQRAY
jgi:stage II sporulation protein D